MNSRFLPDQEILIDNAGTMQKKLLHFWVPPNYEQKNLPLILVLHGGTNDPQTSRRYLEKTDDPGHIEYPMAVGEFWEKTGAVVCAPQSPEESQDSWCIANIKTYLEQVIDETVRRFGIDRDRIFLYGHSMGAFGAYHIAQVCPDMFAALVLSAGRFQTADFKNMLGSRIFIIHGRNDAYWQNRPHHTDFQYAQSAFELMRASGVDVVFNPMDGGHSIRDLLPALERFWEAAKDLKINRYPSEVHISSPAGWTKERLVTVTKRFWLAVEAFRPGPVEIYQASPVGALGGGDWQQCSREEFEKWHIDVEKTVIDGFSIRAESCGNNRFEVETEHVDVFSISVNNTMADLSKPVQVLVNSKEKFNSLAENNEKITIRI